MSKMTCSITDDVMSDPEYATPHEIEMTPLEEIDLRLEAMSQSIHKLMLSVGDSQNGLRRDLASIQNDVFLARCQLDEADL